jgi:hypothetical protein
MKYIKPILAVAIVAIYLALLRYVAPSQEPYFILGTAVIGLVAWLCGIIPGLICALFLIPFTNWVYSQFPAETSSSSYSSFASSPGYLAMQILTAVGLGHLRRDRMTLARKESELENANERLRSMLSKVQELGGIYNMCSRCKDIQDEDGRWMLIDIYLKDRTKMEFSHCICPKCAEYFYGSTESEEASKPPPTPPEDA